MLQRCGLLSLVILASWKAQAQQRQLDSLVHLEKTYALLKDTLDCDYRGKITAKNKGEIDMYFLKG